MSVSPGVQQFINKSLADNNKALLDQISKLVADSADNVKRASVEAADDQLREIKKLRREEPKSFKRKGNELQYKFNAKLQDSFEEAKSHLEVNAIDKAKETLAEVTSLLAERQKLILLADKSDFGWKTVDEYVEHELAVDEEDGKKIRRAEERAEKAVKSTVARKAARRSISSRSSAVRSAPFGSPRFVGPSQTVDFPLAINGCPFLGVHSKLLLGPVTVLRVVSLVTGDLNVFIVRVDRKVIRIAGD